MKYRNVQAAPFLHAAFHISYLISALWLIYLSSALRQDDGWEQQLIAERNQIAKWYYCFYPFAKEHNTGCDITLLLFTDSEDGG